jgi:hypothetical protein
LVTFTNVHAGEGIAVNVSSARVYQHTTTTNLLPLPQLDPQAARVTGLTRYLNPQLRCLVLTATRDDDVGRGRRR